MNVGTRFLGNIERVVKFENDLYGISRMESSYIKYAVAAARSVVLAK